jgi:hypothetical protein
MLRSPIGPGQPILLTFGHLKTDSMLRLLLIYFPDKSDWSIDDRTRTSLYVNALQ